MKIEKSRKHLNGYDLSIGTGKIFHARSELELVYALAHYFGRTIIPESPYDAGKHREHAKVCDCCPLCRTVS